MFSNSTLIKTVSLVLIFESFGQEIYLNKPVCITSYIIHVPSINKYSVLFILQKLYAVYVTVVCCTQLMLYNIWLLHYSLVYCTENTLYYTILYTILYSLIQYCNIWQHSSDVTLQHFSCPYCIHKYSTLYNTTLYFTVSQPCLCQWFLFKKKLPGCNTKQKSEGKITTSEFEFTCSCLVEHQAEILTGMEEQVLFFSDVRAICCHLVGEYFIDWVNKQ